MGITAAKDFERLHELPLRGYQKTCLEAIQNKYHSGTHRQLVSMATGAGKTVVFSHLIRRFKRPALVLAHTCELLEQARTKIKMVCPELEVGIVNGQNKQFNSHVVVASIQSAYQPQNLAKLKEQGFGLVIADECHHFAAESSRTVLNELGFGRGTDCLLVGFTATPFRADGKGLGEVFDEIVFEKSIGSLIEEDYLCVPRGVRVATDLDLREVSTSQGDYSGAALSQIMDTQEIRELILNAYQEHAEGRPTICFGASVAHAKSLEKVFKEAGISSATIHSETPNDERISILNAYKTGETKVLCNCSVLIEGFDAPHTACVIVARPTKSKGLYQQMVGRGLRKYPGKADCLVLDFNDQSHSLCNASILLQDAEVADRQEEERKRREQEIVAALPGKLNKKLQRAFIEMHLFGDAFNWQREGGDYILKATNGILQIATGKEGYQVVWVAGAGYQVVASGLTFEYAFATAQDFAKAHRELFILTDREAKWRDQPISEKQIQIFRSRGYKKGIEKLTRGQASDLIGTMPIRRAS